MARPTRRSRRTSGRSSSSTPPETTIVFGPESLSTSTTAAFAFESDEAGATFECALDGATFAACPEPVRVHGPDDGAHALAVRAIDPSGNVDATPATYGLDRRRRPHRARHDDPGRARADDHPH